MACPYFIPSARRDDLLWPHPGRLPLGAGFGGHCGAPGYDALPPTDADLQERCNLGYARCSRLPAERLADAVRFAVALDAAERLVVTWVLERDHAPAGSGVVEFDRETRRFAVPHPDARIQKQLECYLAGYLERRPRAAS